MTNTEPLIHCVRKKKSPFQVPWAHPPFLEDEPASMHSISHLMATGDPDVHAHQAHILISPFNVCWGTKQVQADHIATVAEIKVYGQVL